MMYHVAYGFIFSSKIIHAYVFDGRIDLLLKITYFKMCHYHTSPRWL